ncbi:MAG: acyl-CoA synthetase FdrA [Candidatus Bipolaricaulis sp.]|nr:acyl-CoA synthetase FdrA [Candidatus Bipolaricaulis sp.]
MRELLVEKNCYFDSVFLLRISREIEGLAGVEKAVVAMGTPANLESLERVGFAFDRSATRALPTDLVIAVEAASAGALERARARLAELLVGRQSAERKAIAKPTTLSEAVDIDPRINLVLISVPGAYAAREARRALRRGLHVFLFSDNVSVEDEIALKDEAKARGLLLMGPDCGTAILNGIPIGFANVVRRGPIGLIGASGTGIQEITSLIDRLGSGVSQAIGTGGRDLSGSVAARSTLAGIDALADDPETAVLAVVSKAPSAAVADRVLDRLRRAGKPTIVQFVASAPRASEHGITFAATLDEAARLACRKAGLDVPAQAHPPEIPHLAFHSRQRFVRGLFCGGTLCQEAWSILRTAGLEVRSNVAADERLYLGAGEKAAGHLLWDLGDDAFTVGRPHPMIEPDLRDRHVAAAGADPSVAVVLVDCVIGYGSHPDPAGSLARAAEKAHAAARGEKRPLVVVSSVTGTARDPQNYEAQRHTLQAAGILVAETNALAAQCAAAIVQGGSR